MNKTLLTALLCTTLLTGKNQEPTITNTGEVPFEVIEQKTSRNGEENRTTELAPGHIKSICNDTENVYVSIWIDGKYQRVWVNKDTNLNITFDGNHFQRNN